MKGENLDALNIPQARSESGDLSDVLSVVG